MAAVRLKRIDDGHYLVPGTDWEIVVEPDGVRWAVWEGDTKVVVCDSYPDARQWALEH